MRRTSTPYPLTPRTTTTTTTTTTTPPLMRVQKLLSGYRTPTRTRRPEDELHVLPVAVELVLVLTLVVGKREGERATAENGEGREVAIVETRVSRTCLHLTLRRPLVPTLLTPPCCPPSHSPSTPGTLQACCRTANVVLA